MLAVLVTQGCTSHPKREAADDSAGPRPCPVEAFVRAPEGFTAHDGTISGACDVRVVGESTLRNQASVYDISGTGRPPVLVRSFDGVAHLFGIATRNNYQVVVGDRIDAQPFVAESKDRGRTWTSLEPPRGSEAARLISIEGYDAWIAFSAGGGSCLHKVNIVTQHWRTVHCVAPPGRIDSLLVRRAEILLGGTDTQHGFLLRSRDAGRSFEALEIAKSLTGVTSLALFRGRLLVGGFVQRGAGSITIPRLLTITRQAAGTNTLRGVGYVTSIVVSASGTALAVTGAQGSRLYRSRGTRWLPVHLPEGAGGLDIEHVMTFLHGTLILGGAGFAWMRPTG